MAKKQAKAETPEAENLDVVYDGIPGADKVTDEDVKPFDVDLNFEEEVKEEESEEAEEAESENVEEDSTETEEPEGEEPVEEVEGEGTESDGATEEDGTPEGDPQQSEEPVAEGTDEEVSKEPMIPKKRFDEVLQKQKALQKKLDEATAPKVDVPAEAPKYDFDSKELEYQNLLLDGEVKKAADLRQEIRTAEKQQTMWEVKTQIGQQTQQSQEQIALQAKAEQIAAANPVLDENHASYNETKTNEVLELRDAYILQGYQGADALQKAVDLLVPADAPQTENVVEKKIVEKKQVANTNKKIEAAEKQPPAMKGKNKTDKKIDIDTLSVDEFDALPDETLRRMRGDFG